MNDFVEQVHPQFTKTNPEELVQILETRLPRSANILNMALLYPNFKDEMGFFILNNISEIKDQWILVIFQREDQGAETYMSAPIDARGLPPEVKNALEIFIDWTRPYKHLIDREYSLDFFRLSVKKGNPIMARPCIYYFFTREEALFKSREIEQDSDDKLLTPLPLEAGSQFFLETYKYSVSGTEDVCRKVTERSLSVGILRGDEILSGAAVKGSGFMGFIYTRESARGQGLAKRVIGKLCSELASQGMVPCSNVEVSNHPSNAFHAKIGMRVSHLIDVFQYFGQEEF